MTEITCRICGHTETQLQQIQDGDFEWTCPGCHATFHIRIVFLEHEAEVDQPRFRQEVERLLNEQALNRSDLARLLGVTPAYVSIILNGRRPIRTDLAKRILHVLRA